MRSTILASLFAAILAACSGDATTTTSPQAGGSPSTPSTADGPETVATSFFEAVQAADQARAATFLTEAAQASLEGDTGLGFDGSQVDSFVVGAVDVSDDQAEVEVTITQGGEDHPNHALLRREGGEWRVYGMRVAIGDGSFTMNFEDPAAGLGELGAVVGEAFEELGRQFEQSFADAQATWEQGGTADEIAEHHAEYAALRPVTRAEHDDAWRIDLDCAGRAASLVLDELFAGTGVACSTKGAPAFERSLDLRLSGVSRVEAVERIAAALDHHPVWPDPSAGGWGEPQELEPVRFAEGLRSTPATFSGPFLVEVVNVLEDAPNTVGELSLAARALGLSPAVISFQEDSGEFARIEALDAADGTSLTDLDMHYMSSPAIEESYFVYAFERPLQGLLRGVEEIASIQGAIHLALPATVEELSFEESSQPRPCSLGTASVSSWGEQVELSIEGERGAFEDVEVRVAPTGPDDQQLGVRFASAMGWGSNLNASVQCGGTPTALAVKLCRTERLSMPFELLNVPLRRSAEQPTHLEPLRFDGDSPAGVTLLSESKREDGDRDLRLRIVNRCNKSLESVNLRFDYVDAAGKVLDQFHFTLTGQYDFDAGAVGPVAAAGATVEEDAWAAFVPEATKSVRVHLSRVEFPDATTWETDQR